MDSSRPRWYNMVYMKELILGLLGVVGGGLGVAVFTYLTTRRRDSHEVWALERDSLHQDIIYLREQLAELRAEVAELRAELSGSRTAANDLLVKRDRAYWKVRDALKSDSSDADVRVEIELITDELAELVGKRI